MTLEKLPILKLISFFSILEEPANWRQDSPGRNQRPYNGPRDYPDYGPDYPNRPNNDRQRPHTSVSIFSVLFII